MEYGWLQTLRDISIIFMTVLLGLAGFAIILFVYFLYRRLAPILESARETVVNIQGTSVFLSERAVRPVIKTVGFITGVRRGILTAVSLIRRRSS